MRFRLIRSSTRSFWGLAIPVAGPFLPGSSQADPSIKPIPFDLDKAKEILDAAGWKDTNGNGDPRQADQR